MLFAVNEPVARRRAGEAARREAGRHYAWGAIGTRLALIVHTSARLPQHPRARPSRAEPVSESRTRRVGATRTGSAALSRR